MKYKLLLCCIASSFVFGITAGAAKLDKVEFNINSTTLEISGVSDKNTKSDLNFVTLRVLKPGETPETIKELSATEKKDAVVFVAQKQADENGDFEFTYTPDDFEYGNHNIYVTDASGKVLYDYALFIDGTEEDRLLGALNGVSDKALIKQALMDYPYVLEGIPAVSKLRASYPDVDFEDEVSGMLTQMTFTSADNTVKEAVKAAVVTAINSAKTNTELINILEDNKIHLKFDDAIYNDLFLKNTETLAGEFLNQDYENSAKFIRDFCDTAILQRFKAQTNYTNVMTVLDCGRQYLEDFKFEEYDSLKDIEKTYVKKSIIDNTQIDTISDLKEAFNTAVINAPYQKYYDDNYVSSGRGGGGGSAIITIGNTSVSNTPKDEQIFNDLQSVEWARESIAELYKAGIVSGMGDNTFNPTGLVTREQFVKMLVNAYGLFDADAQSDFDDVPKNSWYYSFVSSAVKAGIVNGISDDAFGSGMNITRQDMAVMAYRVARDKINNTSYGEVFTDDAEISDYSKEAVYALKGYGIMNGKGDNQFEAKAYATRAEAAKIIYGLINLGGNL